MKKRLLNNWMTTALALVLIGFCMWQMHKGQTAQELAGFFGMAGLLLRSKDSIIGLPKEEDGQG